MFGAKKNPIPVGVPLSRKPDLRGGQDAATSVAAGRCDLYFFVEDSDEIGKLSFERAWACRFAWTDCVPYRDALFSFLLEVRESDWPEQMDSWVYLHSRQEQWFLDAKKKAKHFVAAGNDIYHEFLAEGFTESYLKKGSAEYQSAALLLGVSPNPPLNTDAPPDGGAPVS